MLGHNPIHANVQAELDAVRRECRAQDGTDITFEQEAVTKTHRISAQPFQYRDR